MNIEQAIVDAVEEYDDAWPAWVYEIYKKLKEQDSLKTGR